MVKTLRITMSMKMTRKTNMVIHVLKSLPIIGKRLPEDLYAIRGLKILATIFACFWELGTAFLGKLLFIGGMVFLPTLFYEPVDSAAAMLHVFVLASMVGTRMNNAIIQDDDNAQYLVLLMGMDARQYSLVNYGYFLTKLLAGHLLFGLIFGLIAGVKWYLCLLMPLFTLGAKCAVGWLELRKFQRTGEIYPDKGLNKYMWVFTIALLAAAYILPILEIVLPVWVSATVMVLGIGAGAACVKPLLHYPEYRTAIQYLRRNAEEALEEAGTALKVQSRGAIAASAEGTSTRRGFAYLNDLFVKRHKKILHKPARMAALGAAVLLLGGSAMLYFIPEIRQELELDVMGLLPCFAFVLYAINRGTSYTQALFMNCDYALLTYPFYKEPKSILRLFAVRLVGIVKINLLPGVVVAAGLPLLLYCSGGAESPADYVVLAVSVLAMNVFFSVHYLTLYYLLQPYTAGSELKNFPYSLATGLTYVVCYALIDLEVSPMAFGALSIIFCAAYCAVACVLVYFLAPKTFRIRT